MAYEGDSERSLLYRIANSLFAGAAGTIGAATNADSGTIAASGGTVSISFVSGARAEIVNPSTATLWARWGAAPAVNGAGSFPIVANGSYAPGYGVTGTLQLLSTAASQPYTVNRFA